MRPALLVIFLLAVTALPAAPFEGRINLQRATVPDAPHDLIYRVKGDKNRVEVMRDRVTTFLTDTTTRKTTVILEDDMAYLILPSLEPARDGPFLEKTEEKATLLGHPVQKYVVESDEGTTELWLAEDFGKYTGFGEGFEKPPVHVPGVDVPLPPDPAPWEWALMGQPLFPLRVITRDDSGREVFRLEARTIVAQPLHDRLFLPSSTYRKVETWP